MNDTTSASNGENVRSLKDAIRRVRTAEAERSDVVVELRDAERARLDMLADELKSVFAEVPEDNETFLFTVAGGTPPRLWIDMTSFVVMDRDRRTYRFLKDTRLGRTVILETASSDDVADRLTSYVEERIIERERAMEGDWLIKRGGVTEEPRLRSAVRQRLGGGVPVPPEIRDRGAIGWVFAGLLAGILIGVIGLLAYAWVSFPAG
jgi:hypothetical protein